MKKGNGTMGVTKIIIPLRFRYPGLAFEDSNRQACSPLIQLFFGFASDIDQTNINRDIRDGNWLSNTIYCSDILAINLIQRVLSHFYLAKRDSG